MYRCKPNSQTSNYTMYNKYKYTPIQSDLLLKDNTLFFRRMESTTADSVNFSSLALFTNTRPNSISSGPGRTLELNRSGYGLPKYKPSCHVMTTCSGTAVTALRRDETPFVFSSACAHGHRDDVRNCHTAASDELAVIEEWHVSELESTF